MENKSDKRVTARRLACQLLLAAGAVLWFATSALAVVPEVSFVRDSTNVLVNQQVAFDASVSHDPDSVGILSYAWDFDSDNVVDASGPLATSDHTYLTQGPVVVTLTVTDNDLEVASNTMSFFVSITQPPIPLFTVENSAVLLQGSTLKFDASTSTDADGTIEKYEWDLDGNGVFELDTGGDPHAESVYYTNSRTRGRRIAVGLRATDDFGDVAFDARLFTIAVYTQGADVMFGDASNNILASGPGNDEISGLEGNDKMWGGAGVDTIDGMDGNDWVDGGVGNDFIYGGVGNDYLYGNHDWNVIYGEDGNDILVGDDWPDQLYGGNGRDILVGGRGRDRVWGGGGNDVIKARDRSIDRVWCGAGRDKVYADPYDRLYGCERVIRS